MRDYNIDTTFYLGNEDTVSREEIDFRNIKSITKSGLCSFNGESGGSYYKIILFNIINPFLDYTTDTIWIDGGEYKKLKAQYIEKSKKFIESIIDAK